MGKPIKIIDIEEKYAYYYDDGHNTWDNRLYSCKGVFPRLNNIMYGKHEHS